VKLEQRREGLYAVTLTAHELSALMAGARMSLELMKTDPSRSTERAREALEAVLSDFDAQLARLRGN
jgi:glutathione S-transferase